MMNFYWYILKKNYIRMFNVNMGNLISFRFREREYLISISFHPNINITALSNLGFSIILNSANRIS